MNPHYLIPLTTVRDIKEKKNGITLKVDSEVADITFLKDDLVKIRISQGGKFVKKPSHSCLPVKWPGSKITVSESKENITLKSAKLTVTVTKDNFSLAIHRKDGSCILNKRPGIPYYQYQNNHFIINRECSPNEHIYALGEKTGPLDRHGRKLTLWNTDVLAPDPDKSTAEIIAEKDKSPLDIDYDPYYVSIPFFYRMTSNTLAASGHFIDNPFKGTFNFDNSKNHSHIEIDFNGGQYCEYVFGGPSIADILNDYTRLTGRIKTPPLWSLGYHQCRWKKYSQDAMLKVAENQLKSKVPCESLWLDIDYMDEYRVFTWNEELFPKRKQLFKKLQKMGFRVVTIVDPGIKHEEGYAIFDDARKKGLLCNCENGQIYIGQVWPRETAFPDFSQKNCREWWGSLNAKHAKENGIDGIWNDMNEPSTGKISSKNMRFAGEDGDQSLPHEQFHNEYALLMAEGTDKGLLKADPEKRTFILSRGGSPGIQRYAANWMGDNASRWDHLQMSLPMSMGLGISGQPFVGADIGGFVEPSNPELFVRWMQCGALTPFCRNHNDNTVDQYVWSFGKGVTDLCRKAINMRYRLLPYIYSWFMQSAKDGSPIQRPLVYDFQNDPAVRQIDDQFMLGDSLMAAPVLKQGQTSRNVYLPEGEWYLLSDKKFFKGEQWISVAAPIDTIPVFVRCGVIIPMLSEVPLSTMNFHPESLTLFMALGDNKIGRTSWLYEDDGVTFKREKGQCLDTKFTVSHKGETTTVSSQSKGNKFKEFKRKNFILKVAAKKDITIDYDGCKPDKTPDQWIIKNSGEPLKISLKKS